MCSWIGQPLRPDVLRLRPDQPPFAKLLQAMGRPAEHAPYGERGGEQIGGQPQAVEQQSGIELDIGIEPALRLELAEQAQGRAFDRPRQIV